MSSPAHDRAPPPPLDDEERAFRESLEKLVDFVRVEPPRLFWRAFLPAFALVSAGGLGVAASFGFQLTRPALGLAMLLCGLLVVAAGPAYTLFMLIRAMGRDAYVAIRVDGLSVRLDLGLPETLYPWEALAEVHHDPESDALSLELTNGEQLPLRGPFSGVSHAQLARRIRDARRLAVWQRLTPRPR